jgi:hypothetical protein
MDLLSNKDIGYYHLRFIGILRWAVKLARIDIATEVSMLAAYSAAPRQRYLAAILHVFAYLKAHSHSRLCWIQATSLKSQLQSTIGLISMGMSMS